MPIKIMSDLPSREILERENVFVMDEGRAEHQDIRPIRIGILNLMPLKEETELQLIKGYELHSVQQQVVRYSETQDRLRRWQVFEKLFEE